jgi:hypothetical protein
MCLQIVVELARTKVHENPSSTPRDDICGQEDMRKVTYVSATFLCEHSKKYTLYFTAAFLTISPQSRECDLVSYRNYTSGNWMRLFLHFFNIHTTPWPLSASELYRPSDSRLSAKLVPPFVDRCHVVSATDPQGRIIAFLDRYSQYSTL